MDQDWKKLGEALKAARLARKPKLTQVQVAAALNVSRPTIQNIERGVGLTKVTQTLRAYAQLLGWTPESPDQILAGGEPTGADTRGAGSELARPLGEGLPMTVQDELEREGAVVDTAVVQLPDGTSVTVIVKGASKTPTPEERQRNLDAWRRVQPMLRELTYPADRDSA
ncbi:helix-turn-helix transcriptional regulator [Streptomyces sp. NBC_01565]|uniref:helix-turn-helix domain-containing protein n=1 Tax=Streptomyces sp. NBC_01565 TaxID=2975881 RepID=UPI0022564B42|nr:helix-turn-helix transcriptional regulator [Streptomyces sp. NBC_01565]MCX4543837.1 helix-turn-helix domain-containing protein [Streptomyces sp. NBC_01565]